MSARRLHSWPSKCPARRDETIRLRDQLLARRRCPEETEDDGFGARDGGDGDSVMSGTVLLPSSDTGIDISDVLYWRSTFNKG